MNNPELYKKTCDILVDAYFNDTLEHSSCSACAVGNICRDHADALDLDGTEWAAIFFTDSNSGQQLTSFNRGVTHFCYSGHRNDGLSLIAATGYTPQELAKVEYAFETAPKGNSKEDYIFNGLMATIEALDKIHGNTDTELTATTKNRFNKAPQL